MIKFLTRAPVIVSALFLTLTLMGCRGSVPTKPQNENKTVVVQPTEPKVEDKEGVDQHGIPLHIHKRIAEGCSYKSEMVFYIADEVIYNGGTVAKMERFMAERMSNAEYRIKIKLFTALHQWVDETLAQHPGIRATEQPVHELTWGFFQTCMKTSYEAMSIKPVPLTRFYMESFGKILEVAEEGNIPVDA